MGRRWVIPDIHGHSKTLRALVDDLIKPRRYDELYFLGDYIDRGPDSKGVIDYIRSLQQDEYRVTALRGNHEEVLLDLYDAQMRSRNAWWFNFGDKKNQAWTAMGGKAALTSFGAASVSDIPATYIDWIRSLGHYVLLDDFVLVHAGLNFKNEDPFQDKLSMLWLREYDIYPERIGGRRIIHGHVPVNMELISMTIANRTSPFIDIDNGPYLQGRNGFGNLVALELNSMEMVIQNNLD